MSVSVDAAKLVAVRQKYAEEAKKRLRPDGSAQFTTLESASDARLRVLAEDPWVDHDALNAQTPAIVDGGTYRFFVVGAGFGGLQFGVQLQEAGVATAEEIRLVDAAGGFGGTWYWNRFPGLHCDVESYLYLPLLEETGYVPTHKYASAEEIRLHAERIAAQWHLVGKALFRTEVQSLDWDDAAQRWTVHVVEHRGPREPARPITIQADYVYLAAGVLTRPQVPKLPGLLSFQGPFFHTARWDYGVTGGGPTDHTLSKLSDKRVGIIGTASTSISAIPVLGRFAKELYVFQRTPSYVKARNQRPTDPEEWRRDIAARPGWQRARADNYGRFLTNSAEPGERDLVDDGWSNIPGYSAHLGSSKIGVLTDTSPAAIEQHVTQFHALDLPHQEAVRARVDAVVGDRATAEALKPWYPSWCKRPTFSDTYLQTFNARNVHLVDTDGQGVDRVTPTGVVVAGQEYPLDVLIFSTGFGTAARAGSPAARVAVSIRGRGGQSVDDKWKQGGAQTLHGFATHGFPNLFFTGVSQATITGSNTGLLGIIAEHVVSWLAASQRRVGPGKRAVIEVTPEGERKHTAEVARRAPYFAALADCTPGNFNGHGDALLATDPASLRRRAQGAMWSEGSLSFQAYLKAWRDEGSLQGLSVEAARPLKASL